MTTAIPASTNMQINYSSHPTPFGICLLAVSAQQICWLSLHDEQLTECAITTLLTKNFPAANFSYAPTPINPLITSIFTSPDQLPNFAVQLAGTPFQKQVWHQLQEIPAGTTVSYSTIAQQLGRPRAVRAVARAIAQNKIALLIPCHRVISKSGAIHNYRWGKARKQQLLSWEQV